MDMCRLCMKAELLLDLYEINKESTLAKKIYFCIDIEVPSEDNLPSFICKQCFKKIKKFYTFKYKSLKVDIALKNMKYHTINNIILDDDLNSLDNEIKESKVIQNKSTFVEATDILSQQNASSIKNKINIIQKTQKKTNNTNSNYQCELCGHTFKMKTVLEKHLMIHSGIKPYSCKICPRRFARAENKIIHMRSHLGIKPFICEICGKTSTKNQDLKRHMKVHNDERNYSCSRCKLKFKRSSDLTSHMRTHTGIRPYCCLTCTKRYASHSGLSKHYKKCCRKEII
ncbi:zinc finger protein 43-like isoform X2 [Achroia grisella]|nr:zinc finger protein 43-like isoform X2 [Achroia grisella]